MQKISSVPHIRYCRKTERGNMKVLILIALIALATPSLGRVFTRCELAHAYIAHGITERLEDWVCLAEKESSLNSAAVGGPNSNGSFDWGIFQINDGYWCSVGEIGKDCNIACESLIDDDITDDLVCVDMIYARHGFTAWHAWVNKCQEELPDLTECFE